MSNPLKRRMAKAVLVLAAGAAPVMAAAGQASALPLPLPQDGGLDGLPSVDDATVQHTLDRSTQSVTDVGNGVGGEVVQQAMPVVAPALQQATENTTHTTGTLARGAATTLAGEGPSPDRVAELVPSVSGQDFQDLSIL